MSRIAALIALIAFAVLSTSLASARPMGVAGMPAMSAGMTMAEHRGGAADMPCGEAGAAMCDICCIAAPAAAWFPGQRPLIRARFGRAMDKVQTGLAVLPALPPPRRARATL